jgi:hypothetical protein
MTMEMGVLYHVLVVTRTSEDRTRQICRPQNGFGHSATSSTSGRGQVQGQDRRKME